MIGTRVRKLLIAPVPVSLLVLVGCVAGLISAPPQAAAQSTVLNTCHAAIILDRSGSVGEDLDTMKSQVLSLFDPTGIYNDKILLGFWSFSSEIYTTSSNYDAPFHDYVPSKGVDNGFRQSINALVSAGGTNYEQGLGYHQGVMNTRDGIDQVINKADVLAFLTDGVPNTPGSGDNNATARNAARAAVLKHRAAGRLIVAGIIGNSSQASLNYVINGSDSNSKDVFKIAGFSNLKDFLKDKVAQKCSEIVPETRPDPYSLTPIVTSNDRVASGAGSATFSYSVNDNARNGSTEDIHWSIKRVLVDRGHSVEPLYFGDDAYRDNYSCTSIILLIEGNGSCTDVASGHKIFGPGTTSLDADAASATNVLIDDSWQVGTKVCYILTLDKPTRDDAPVDRFSQAACIAIGKRPFVQVHGGDIRVGRHFITDTTGQDGDSGDPDLPSSVSTSVTTKASGKTYGSWAEYGVIASGLVTGFASLSGLEGGYDSTLPDSQEFWSKLTFANTDNQYGLYTPDDPGVGTIPDVVSALVSGARTKKSLAGDSTVSFNGTSVASGLYEKETGNLKIDTSLIEKNKSIIVYVPDGKVTITGNIAYNDGPYTSMSQIPQLVIIAKDIDIDEDVTQVDAWLIANGDDGGTISTCNYEDTLTSEVCNQLLVINGPVMAHHLNLRRTGGAGTGGASGDPAEIINLPGSSYLWSQSEGHSDVKAQTTSTTELPPYF